jgi:hypothetical protein
MREYLTDRSSIVRTFALQALVALSENHRRLRPRVDAVLADALRTGTPAMRARARRILARRTRDSAEKNERQHHPARGDTRPAPTPKKR